MVKKNDPSNQRCSSDFILTLFPRSIHPPLVSSVPSPTPSSLFSDPDHLKKMSKSIPLFLQKEVNLYLSLQILSGSSAFWHPELISVFQDDAFTDSTSDHSYRSGQLTKGGSLTNLTTSSGLSSVCLLAHTALLTNTAGCHRC